MRGEARRGLTAFRVKRRACKTPTQESFKNEQPGSRKEFSMKNTFYRHSIITMIALCTLVCLSVPRKCAAFTQAASTTLQNLRSRLPNRIVPRRN